MMKDKVYYATGDSTTIVVLTNIGNTSARKWISIEIRTKFNLIHEHEWTGNSISDICKKYEISRKTYYKWKNRYIKHGIDGLKDLSRKPHNIKRLSTL